MHQQADKPEKHKFRGPRFSRISRELWLFTKLFQRHFVVLCAYRRQEGPTLGLDWTVAEV